MSEMPSPKKRKAAHPPPELGTSISAGSLSLSSDDDDEDNDEAQEMTPRPHRTSRLSHSTSGKSTQSGGSSPRKHLAAMNLFDRSVVIRNLSDTARQTPALLAMRSRLLSLHRGRGILGESHKSIFSGDSLASLHPDFATLSNDADFFFSPERDILGQTPSPEDVSNILDSAAECTTMDQPESGWNAEVHHPLLALALRQRRPGQTFKALVKFMSCSSAALIKEYKLPSAPDKKIDFCIFIDPEYDLENPDMAIHVDNLRAQLPLISINVTSEFSLLKRPLAILIETKRSGEGGDNAALQLTTWLEAQLELLHRLVSRCQAIPSAGGDLPTLNDIGFIPGVIVQGHDWNFVAATREGHETVIWSKMFIGSTGDILGIYQIVNFLQILREWTVKVYWPWLSRVIHRAIPGYS
ncbi:hypothetical protein ACHAPT_013075 [Fusarium lateritium]